MKKLELNFFKEKKKLFEIECVRERERERERGVQHWKAHFQSRLNEAKLY